MPVPEALVCPQGLWTPAIIECHTCALNGCGGRGAFRGRMRVSFVQVDIWSGVTAPASARAPARFSAAFLRACGASGCVRRR